MVYYEACFDSDGSYARGLPDDAVTLTASYFYEERSEERQDQHEWVNNRETY